jgi:hypothetical protein
LIRASALVNRQSTSTCRSFRSFSYAATTCRNRPIDSIRRSRHWGDRAANSHSATYSHDPSFVV